MTAHQDDPLDGRRIDVAQRCEASSHRERDGVLVGPDQPMRLGAPRRQVGRQRLDHPATLRSCGHRAILDDFVKSTRMACTRRRVADDPGRIGWSRGQQRGQGGPVVSNAERLDGKVAIVTGAGQGVGRGAALALAAEGVRTVVCGRTLTKCEAVAAEIDDRGGEALAVRCDTTRSEDVEACVARAVERWHGVDILVNAAQEQIYGSVRRLSEADLDAMWQSGPVGTFRFMRAAFDHLRHARGCVVNLGSGSSLTAPPSLAGYAMAKEAVRVLTRAAAVEWGRYGIRVNAVCPLAESPGFAAFRDQHPGVYEEAIAPAIPLGRVGDAERDVGRAIVFLCGPDAEYITGTTLMVDGGYTYLR
jgi:NAD(P)-dependent dehydrogenase (short-subunit alcohol dehydrogenase family)